MINSSMSQGPDKRHSMSLLISGALYLASCALPCLRWTNGNSIAGWEALLFGWMGVFYGQFAWLANPLYLVALLGSIFGRGRWVTVVSLACVFLGLFTVTLFFAGVPADGSNVNQLRLQTLGPGAWLWMASFLLLVYANGRRAPIPHPFIPHTATSEDQSKECLH